MGPPGVVLQEELESVQKRAARSVTGNYNYEAGSITGFLGQLNWESLKKRRKDNKLILLYKEPLNSCGETYRPRRLNKNIIISPGIWQFGLGLPGVVLQEELESVQKRAARFVIAI